MKKLMSGFLHRIKSADVFGRKAFTALYSSAFACLMIIAVAQVGLKSTATREFFTKIDTYEGAYFEATAEVHSDQLHTVTLHATGDGLKDAEIYLNGNSYSALISGNNEIKIDEPAVIEVYAPNGAVTVKLESLSDGLVLYTPEKEITADKGIKIFGRVGIK